MTMNVRISTVVIALMCAAAALAQPEARGPRPEASVLIVMLPFDNFSGVQDAPKQVSALIEKSLVAKGWRLGMNDRIEATLENERVRYLDSLDPAVITKILEASGAEALLSGTIYTYSDSRNPVVAVSARMIRADGTLAWSDLAASSADDTEKILGFGRKTTTAGVASATVTALMRRFPSAGAQSSPVPGRSKPLFHSGPASFRAKDFDNTPQRVCVLPFDNLTPVPEAARVVTDIVALRLAAAEGFDVVEPAMLRSAALKARIGSFRGIGSDDLAKLAAAVGTPLFIRGTVYKFVDPAARAAGEPELQIELSLIDVRAGRVLWAAQHGRKGSEYVGFLMLGNVSTTVSLTDRVVSEMIDAELRDARRAGVPAKSARSTRARTPEKHSELHGKSGEKR